MSYVAGDYFGELALIRDQPRAATVKAKEDSMVWVIDRQNFKEMLMKVSETKIKEYRKYLDGVQILAPLLMEEKTEIAKALVEMHFTKGELIIQQGEKGNTFYILYEGKVEIFKDGKEQPEATLEASVARNTARYFGEKALLENDNRAATVKVCSETAKTLVLDREAFNMLLGPLEERQSPGDALDGVLQLLLLEFVQVVLLRAEGFGLLVLGVQLRELVRERPDLLRQQLDLPRLRGDHVLELVDVFLLRGDGFTESLLGTRAPVLEFCVQVLLLLALFVRLRHQVLEEANYLLDRVARGGVGHIAPRHRA